MRKEDRAKYIFISFIVLPILFWLIAVKKTEVLKKPKIKHIFEILISTHQKPVLIAAILGGLAAALLFGFILHKIPLDEFTGAKFKKFIRGSRIESGKSISSKTKEKNTKQVLVAGIPMPTKLELLHLLVVGSTGTGKTVLLNNLIFSFMKRKDRAVILDPNGDAYSKFGKPNDKIINPYDCRTEGWTIFNEIKNDYDFQRYAYSLVPLGETAEQETWNSYGRLLLRETARKLDKIGTPDMRELFYWVSIAPPEDLKKFLKGTLAESLFVGSSEATRALSSARFVLSDKLPEHVSMPKGNFSIREWLEDDTQGNLYIPWREDMGPALRPLISAWVDVVCSSILSMNANEERKIWLVIDELASLEKLASLKDALTKGRKHGLRVVAGLQSTAQLDSIYGQHDAQVIRSCIRSLVVLGGSKTDYQTSEDMSKALGEHEVERDKRSRNSGAKGSGVSNSDERSRERIVTPTEIADLAPLQAFVAFAAQPYIARTTVEIQQFKRINDGIVEW